MPSYYELISSIVISLATAFVLWLGATVVSSGAGLWDVVGYLRIIGPSLKHGIRDVYGDRSEIERRRKEPKMHDYIRSAKKSFIYVGLVFDDSDENLKAISDAINDRSITVEIVFWDSPSAHVLSCALDFLNVGTELEMKNKISKAWRSLANVRSQLDGDARAKLILKTHDKPIFFSAFVRDYEASSAETFLDFKLYRIASRSLALRLGPRKYVKRDNDETNLYLKATRSILLIKDAAVAREV